MELLVASAVGLLTAAGLYLILRLRSFPVIIGLAILSYAVNVFIFASGRLAIDKAPVLLKGVTDHADPLTQALVLTAIVISFAMTAVIVLLSLGAFLETGSDRIEMTEEGQE
ncbi:MAG: Na+/H+ antiporter subunit C [Paracoccaceae bacterium]|nr:Na+/H+ antiporter subunit C [Paracoccaceae bacterium]